MSCRQVQSSRGPDNARAIGCQGYRIVDVVLVLLVRVTDALCFTGASQSWWCIAQSRHGSQVHGVALQQPSI